MRCGERTDSTSEQRPWRYAVITPCKNDALLLPCLAGSLLLQTVRPTVWVIVDDSSSDPTLPTAKLLAREYSWIRVVATKSPGTRKGGARVANAFLTGYELISNDPFDFVAKLDVDLSLPPNYFERIFERFDRDQSLGICGGHCYEIAPDGSIRKEWVPDEHVRGATKVYRKTCFDSIGGIVSCDGWDTVDEMRAQMKGWRTASVDSPYVLHLRRTGSVGGVLRGRMYHGRIAHYLGYHPLFVLVRCIRLCLLTPPILGGFAFLLGFLLPIVERKRRFVDADMRRYIQGKQLVRLRRWRDEFFAWRSRPDSEEPQK